MACTGVRIPRSLPASAARRCASRAAHCARRRSARCASLELPPPVGRSDSTLYRSRYAATVAAACSQDSLAFGSVGAFPNRRAQGAPASTATVASARARASMSSARSIDRLAVLVAHVPQRLGDEAGDQTRAEAAAARCGRGRPARCGSGGRRRCRRRRRARAGRRLAAPGARGRGGTPQLGGAPRSSGPKAVDSTTAACCSAVRPERAGGRRSGRAGRRPRSSRVRRRGGRCRRGARTRPPSSGAPTGSRRCAGGPRRAPFER